MRKMSEQLGLTKPRAVSPYLEMGAYEALWDREPKTSFKKIADLFRENPGCVPSDLVPEEEAEEYAAKVIKDFHRANVKRFGVKLHRAGEYPSKLRDATHPVELLYFSGWWDLAHSPSIAIVGTRKPTEEGVARTRKLVRNLVADDFTIVSGLAAGIDSVAHRTALEIEGRTIAVIGTPLSNSYPRENQELQRDIAAKYLVISQIPVSIYKKQGVHINRFFFPERNITMSALTLATVIIEAGETSGTLTQARAALKQGRKLFILDSCFQNSNLTWPAKFAAKGAIRVKNYEDIRVHLVSKSPD